MKFLLSQLYAGKFRLNRNFWLSFIEEETSNLRRSNICFQSELWQIPNTIKQQTTFLELSLGKLQMIKHRHAKRARVIFLVIGAFVIFNL